MSIFKKIKEKIFGKDNSEQTESVADEAKKDATKDGNREAIAVVDVEQRLDAIPGADRLNWRESIVDLMKLVGLDASYEERKELAQELGRPEYSGSAEDNVWLHWAVMKGIAENGGQVPEKFRD